MWVWSASLPYYCHGLNCFIGTEAPAHAITNVTVHMADGSTIENTNIVWRNGIIEQVGVNATIPFDAFVIDGGDSSHVFQDLLMGWPFGGVDVSRDLPRLENPGKPPYDRAGLSRSDPSPLLK